MSSGVRVGGRWTWVCSEGPVRVASTPSPFPSLLRLSPTPPPPLLLALLPPSSAQFQNSAVVEALLKLLTDEDPNVRAVAAISLGRTGTTDETIVDRLIALLEDKDRIVRQSACLSLGHLRAEKAVPHIGHIW